MKQRVTLARAILHKPDILFLDEPTSALDPVNVQNIHKILKDLNKEGTTIFLTTHNMDEAETLCNRIAFLCGGEIVALDTPENLRLQYAKDQIQVVLKDKKKETVQKDELGAKRISEWMNKGELLSIHSHEPTLGDIFIEVTGRDYNDIFNETCISYFRKEVQDFKTNSQVLLMAFLPIILSFLFSRFGAERKC